MDLDLTYGMLVNKTAPYCAADYEAFDFVEVVSIRNRPVQIERQTYEHFQQLRAHMENEGVRIGIIQGRRSEAEQAAIYREFIEKFGKERADQLVAPVGTSEHHTGLALDVEVYGEGLWLNNHADRELAEPLLRHVHPWLAEYGFLLRYPEGKEAITTIGYEPWHIRYVGRELAKHLAERQWTLEEFYMEERG